MATPRINLDWIIEKYLPYFQTFQVTDEALRTYFKEWREKKPTSPQADFFWHVFQLIVKAIGEQTHTEEQRYKMNAEVYSKMVEYLVRDENRNGNHVKRAMHENELRYWQIRTSYKIQIEIISGHCCTYCDSLDKKIISIEEALEKQYLASKQCTREWGCNCCYAETFVRDENGLLIKL